MTIYAKHTEADWGCGLSIVGNFTATRPADGYSSWNPSFFALTDIAADSDVLEDEGEVMGTGYAVATFIDNEICEEAYTTIRDNFTIVYQSEVRRNRNSGNDFFFIVYDTR